MKPDHKSQTFLAITRSKAKMIEYGVPVEHRDINFNGDTLTLFPLAIGLLGDVAAAINGEANNSEDITNLKNDLVFSAYFFDSYLNTQLNQEFNDYLILLGSAAYYLCEFPGSSRVLANQIEKRAISIGGGGLEYLLLWLLTGDYSIEINRTDKIFNKFLNEIPNLLKKFNNGGIDGDKLLNISDELREITYKRGTTNQLLYGDIIAALIKKKYNNSCWIKLPEYSGIELQKWLPIIRKKSFIKELWPAQHLIGQAGVLQGKSAIIQMPTSAGKTKASELIIRSSFLANRTTLAVIIAPFKALCHEIKNSFYLAFKNENIKVDELSDVFQTDFDLNELLNKKQIIVVTPEKLLFVLRQSPELAKKTGLVIFDEGHQFDNVTRGITYELLVTSLISLLPQNSQKILISAVISNAKILGDWLNGDDSEIISGMGLSPTYRSIGFASWLDTLGQIKFLSDFNSDANNFYVPRVIEQFTLQPKPKERKTRVFPEKNDWQSIALFLGLKLVINGSVAVFTGKKATATNLCEKAVDVFERNISIIQPAKISDSNEMQRLIYLIVCHMGNDAIISKAAKLGIFSHHGNTPQGIRLSIEHAMRENHIHFVICTSTLAQGVNLPIRYLIISNVYQGSERIKVRDFHNLMGRAGRADKHTEGSILFADPTIYDKRNFKDEKWRWKQAMELLDPAKSEPCISTLLSLFDPFHSDDYKYSIKMEAMEFCNLYIEKPEELENLPSEFFEQHGDKNFTINGIKGQIQRKNNLISSIESFLVSNLNMDEGKINEDNIIELAKSTLAYFIADPENKEHIINLFVLLAKNIINKIPDKNLRKVYGKTLYGINDAKEIEEWVKNNQNDLKQIINIEAFLDLFWDLIASRVNSKSFLNCTVPSILKEIAYSWLKGKPYRELFSIIKKSGAVYGTRPRRYKIEDIVDIFDLGFSYDATLLINSIIEFIIIIVPENTDEIVNKIKLFQKMIKYGLPNELSIIVFELGFVDRVIAQEIAENLICFPNKDDVINQLKLNKTELMNIIEKYPLYFTEIFNRYVSE